MADSMQVRWCMDVEQNHQLMGFWLTSTERCVLFSVGHELELRLYCQDELVALEPCKTGAEALRIAERWRHRVPQWPPY